MRAAPAFAALAILLVLAPSGAAREGEETAPAPTPDKNFSFIHSTTEWVAESLRSARQAAADGEWARAARTLQALTDTVQSRESPLDAAPYVAAVQGSAVFEGVWVHARLALAALPAEGRAAYAQEYGPLARSLVAQGLASRSEEALVEAARRFLPLPEGRRAALHLVDLALERGDADAALGWLEQMEDVEAASAEAEESLAPWRRPRVERWAAALGVRPDARAEVARRMSEVDASDASAAATAEDEVAPLLAAPAPPGSWLTSGGDRTRAARVEGLGHTLTLQWALPPLEAGGLSDSVDPAEEEARPSPWLPPRAVATEDHVFVSDGERLHVLEVATGRYAVSPEEGALGRRRWSSSLGTRTDESRRPRFGWLEGHTLTLHPVRDFRAGAGEAARGFPGAGWLVLAAVPDGRSFNHDEPDVGERDDHIAAFHWDGRRLERLWTAGGSPEERGDEENGAGIRLFGAPLVYRDRIWVAGLKRSTAARDRIEAWLLALDPATGAVAVRTHLGTGTPVRRDRLDEVVPASPAAARGRVVVATSLGILAAVDAEDGRPHWVYLYNRAVETDRGNRRIAATADETERPSSFLNEPPLLVGHRVIALPTDGDQFCVLFDRPRGAQRLLRAYDGRLTHRIHSFYNFAAEHVAGVVPPGPEGPPLVLFVGQGQGREPPGPVAVARNLLTMADPWAEPSPTGFGGRPYGRALLTREELFVPLREGIAVFSARDGALRAVLDRDDVPVEFRAYAPETPYGNLIPVPGRGILSVSATTVAFWSH